MIQQFYPDEWLDSAYVIDYEQLYKEGYRGLIFDIDNTLVPHGAPADERAIALFKRLREIGFSCCLLSNNSYIFKAGKPGKNGYEQAMRKIGTNKKTTVFIGDQLFTDVWGAKRVGIRNILVKPINPKEEIQIVLKRRLEWIILYFYKKTMKK